MAGVIGVEPWSFSLRQLFQMFEAARLPLTQRALIAALTHNAHAGKDTPPKKTADFDPFGSATRRTKAKSAVTVGKKNTPILARAFT